MGISMSRCFSNRVRRMAEGPRFASLLALLLLLAPACRRDSARPEGPGGESERSVRSRPTVPAAPTENVGSETRSADVTKPRYYRRVVALCIGVNRYRFDSGIPELAFAEQDAKALGEILAARYGYEPRYLLGKDATRHAIDETLGRLAAELTERDALLVFFAGHGQVIDLPSYGRAGYLLPYDAELDLDDRGDPEKWAEEALDMATLVDRIEALPAQHVLLVADSCCSGFMTRRGNIADRSDLQALLTGSSRAVLAASTEKQAAREDRSKGHGYFTAALLAELDREEASSLTDLFVGVRTRVSGESNKLMLPQMAHVGEGDGEFVFLPQAIPEEEIALALNLAPGAGSTDHPLRGVQERAAKRARRRTTAQEVVAAFEAADYRFTARPADGEREWVARFRRFQENASQGDPLAMAAVSRCFAKGLGTEKDPNAAYRSAVLAYETGTPAGRFALGRCLADGIGTTRNEQAGEGLIRESADGGFPLGKLAEAGCLLGKKDIAGAKPLLEQASTAGVLRAKVFLADLYFEGGSGIERDTDRAMAILSEAADAGLPEAQYRMFERLSGDTPRKDLVRAGEWLAKAADGGDRDAQAALARETLQLEGAQRRLDLPRDREAARKWAELAAAQGSSAADLMLCEVYEKGLGVPVDAEKAKEHCERAANANDPEAYLRQGLWWYHGRIFGAKDVVKAKECFRRAADLGQPTACFNLAQVYLEERLTTRSVRDTPAIAHWYTQAARHGHRQAIDELPRVFRNFLHDQEGWWTSFVDEYPESAKEMVRLLDLDPAAPWTTSR